jgi:hypothetical protein
MKTLGQIAYDYWQSVLPCPLPWEEVDPSVQVHYEQMAKAVAQEVIRRQSGTSIETGSISGPSFRDVYTK